MKIVSEMKGFDTGMDLAAYIVSGVFYPVVTIALGVTSFTYFELGFPGFQWLAVFLLVGIVPEMIHILLNRGSSGTLKKEDRAKHYVSSLLLCVLTSGTLLYLGAPGIIVKLVVTAALGITIFMLVNTRTKISVHSGFSFGAAALNVSNPAFPLLILAALTVSWSRLRLDRHTVKQVFYGALLGFLIGLLPGLTS